MNDRELSDRFYDSVDTFIQMVGAERVSKTDVYFRISRAAIGTNIDYSEMTRIVAGIKSFYTWYDAWAKSADKYLLIAQTAEQRGFLVTAGENYLRTALLFHYAQLFTRPEDPRRMEGQNNRVAYYRKACPYLSPPVEEAWIDFGNVRMPGYLRLPDHAQKPNVVIMIPGANSVKEELHNWGWEFNQRGLATLIFDGPGQGELSLFNGGLPLRLETYHEAVSAVIDYLQRRADVDTSRIIAWGQSTGGQLAIRSAAKDDRIFAAVSLGGGYDFRMEITPTTPADVWEEARDLYGFEDFTRAKMYIIQEGSLEGIAEKVKCPLLLIHGAKDNIVAMEEIDRIKRESKEQTDVLIYDQGNHSVCNYNLEMRADMADWVLNQLKKKAGKGGDN